MPDWREGDVESSGINIHYYRTGAGNKPSLVLAHGFTDNGLCWFRTAKQLEAEYDVSMVDARNHGKSGQGTAHQRELAADLAAVIIQLELAPALVAGHSVGGSVATVLAAYYPELVAALVLEDPPWKAPHQAPPLDPLEKASKLASRAQTFRDSVASLALQTHDEIVNAGKRQHPSWHAEEFPPWAISNLQVHAEAMADLVMEDWADLIPLLRCPTLLVHADVDKGGMVSVQTAAAVRALNPLATTQHVLGGGHNLRREAFEDFINVVKPFLAANGGASKTAPDSGTLSSI